MVSLVVKFLLMMFVSGTLDSTSDICFITISSIDVCARVTLAKRIKKCGLDLKKLSTFEQTFFSLTCICEKSRGGQVVGKRVLKNKHYPKHTINACSICSQNCTLFVSVLRKGRKYTKEAGFGPFCKNKPQSLAVVVAPLAERPLPIPEICGSNPVIGKNILFFYCQLY